MTHPIEKVAVLGAGTMGAGIAAHVANAGLPVLLLDIAPRELTPDEEKRGLTLESPKVRNRIVRAGFERLLKTKPPAFMSEEAKRRVALGNFEDDFEKLRDVDWIVEAVVEKLEIKRPLLGRLEKVRAASAIVTTNTSGLPIHALTEDRGEAFRRHFFGTHFFNPPRYMKLLEIIPGEADPAAVAALEDFATQRLGKGVVTSKDTPNFIANRVLSVHSSYVFRTTLEGGYRFEEVDAITGPLIGRPKTATFRLQDLVGIDVAHYVAQNLHELIPDDPYREELAKEAVGQLIGGLVERGRLGNKSGEGFYKKARDEKGRTTFLVLDPKTFDYEPQQEVRFESVGAVRKIADLGERLRELFSERFAGDRAARLAWDVVGHLLAYAAHAAPEIAHDLPSVDDAVRWGFSYEAGPFELWDLLGVAETAEKLEASGHDVAPWVREMLQSGRESFYRREAGRIVDVWDWQKKAAVKPETDPRAISIELLRGEGRELESNAGASLHNLGEGVLLCEFHSKANAIDGDVVAMLQKARELLDEDVWKGLVIGNDGDHFSVGADLRLLAKTAEAGERGPIEEMTRALQEALRDLRHSGKPTVAAVHGMALGGGCEVALGMARIVAAAESYFGLVEAGVGLIPAGGGLKELVRRVITPAMALAETDALHPARKVLETVAMAKVSSSAAEAAEMGFLGPEDRIVMNRGHLLSGARAEVLTMLAEGWAPPPAEELYAGGRDLLAALDLAVWSLAQAGWASAHDARVAGRVAWVIAGGDLSAPARLGDDYFLELEREAFSELAIEEKTRERIVYMLKTGKPLRN